MASEDSRQWLGRLDGHRYHTEKRLWWPLTTVDSGLVVLLAIVIVLRRG